MSRHSHDRARAIGNEHIVGDKDRDLLFVDRVDRHNAVQTDAGLLFGNLGALKVGLLRRLCLVGAHLIHILNPVRPLLNHRVLRRNDHIRCAIERVRAGGIDGELVPRCGGEIHLRARRAADPIALLRLDALRVIHQLQIVDQALGVFGDLQHPLGLDLVHHFAAAAFADALHDLFVGKHAFTGGAPVDGHLLFISQPVFKELKENPLRPFVIVRVRRIDLAGPVKRNTQRLELLLKARDVLLRYDGRVYMVLDSIVFGRQAKRVPADRIQDIIALQAAFPRHDVQRRIGTGMPHVEPLAGRIREFDQRVILRLVHVRVGGVKNTRFFPLILPLLFNWLMVIFVHDLFRSQKLFFVCLQDFCDVHGFAVLPQAVQIVECAGFLRKDMYNHIAVVQQNPGIGTVPLGVLRRNRMPLFELKFHFIRQRLDMRTACTGGNDKIVRQHGNIADSDELEIHSFFLIQYLNGFLGQFQ